MLSDSVLLFLAVFPSLWRLPSQPVSDLYLVGILFIAVRSLTVLLRVVRHPRDGIGAAVRPFQNFFGKGFDLCVFASLLWMIRESGANPWIAFAFSMPLVGTVAFRIVRDSRTTLLEQQMSLFRDATLALLLGAFGLLAVAGLRWIQSGNTETIRSALNLLGKGYPLLILTAGASAIMGAVSQDDVRRSHLLISFPMLAVASLFVQAVSLEMAYISYRQMTYLISEHDPSKAARADLPLSRMRRCRQIFQTYRLDSLSRKAQLILIEQFGRRDDLRQAFDEIRQVERLFPDLRMKAVSRLASAENLQRAAYQQRVFSNAWRDVELGPGGELWLLDRWGRLFVHRSSDQLELVRDSPFLLTAETGSVHSPDVPEAVDFEFDAAMRVVLILDSWGRVFAQGMGEGRVAYRLVAEFPVSSRARDLVLIEGEESFYVLEGCGLVWRGLPVTRNPLPEEPLWDWDIGRSFCLQSGDGFFILDGFAGLHPFGNAVFPGPKKSMPYWGHDWAVDFELGQSGTCAVLADSWGNLYVSTSDQDPETKVEIRSDPPIPFAVDIELDESKQEVIILSRGGTVQRVRDFLCSAP